MNCDYLDAILIREGFERVEVRRDNDSKLRNLKTRHDFGLDSSVGAIIFNGDSVIVYKLKKPYK